MSYQETGTAACLCQDLCGALIAGGPREELESVFAKNIVVNGELTSEADVTLLS